MATLQARQQATVWTTEQAAKPQARPAVDWGEVLHLAQYPHLVVTLTTALTAALVLAGHDWGLVLPSAWFLWVFLRGRARPGELAPDPPKTRLDRAFDLAGGLALAILAAGMLAFAFFGG